MDGIDEILEGMTDSPAEEEEPSSAGENKPEVPEEEVAGEEELPKEEEEPKAEGEEEATPDAKPDESTLQAKEIKELRQMLRDARREMSVLKGKLAKVERGIEPGEGEEEGETRLEQLQNEIMAISEKRGSHFSDLLEVMEMNPKYQDVRSVCTRSNFDDIIEAAARNLAAGGKKSFEEAVLEIELSVWRMGNPYKYMYEVIKKYHPSFAEKKNSEAVLEEKGKRKTPVVAPSSVANTAGGQASGGAWTAARIDAMEPEELDKVPSDIYRKYLAGELK